ncbi:alpha/beta hydrolase family protein [Paraglaciecola arctica]|nr:alpha/beta hydrolase family protein [Paraglaciecola arctica]
MGYLIRVIIVIKFLLLFILVTLCFQSYGAPDKQLLRRLDIQRGLFSDTYQSFEINDQPVIYVLRENSTAITRGVAVMIADTGVPITSQEGFSPLAKELNKIGWVTILLPAPDAGFTPTIIDVEQEPNPVENEDIAAGTEPVSATESQELSPTETAENLDISQSAVSAIDNVAFIKHEQQLVALLQAVIEKAKEYPGFLLVISKGTSAAWLSKIYAEKTVENPDAFVAISPFWPDRKHNQRLPIWIANTTMPVLDLFSGGDNGWAQMTVAERQIAAVKALKLQYRQRKLLGFNTSAHHSGYVSKEIYGWVSRMGW